MKKILFCLIIISTIIIISIKVNYNDHIIFSIGNNIDGDYKYLYHDTRIKDIINDIDDNIIINNRHIQNILIKADKIYIDLNELVINNNTIIDIEKLVKEIRLYTKENIIIILLKDNNYKYKTINNWIFKLKEKYDIMIER